MADPDRHVLDASALLCLMRNEPGADRVADALPDAVISAANLSEVIAKLADLGGDPGDAIEDIRMLQIEVVALDQEQAELAGQLRNATRGAGLSLGDRACLALAIRRGAVAMTTDRAWAGIADAAGVRVITVR